MRKYTPIDIVSLCCSAVALVMMILNFSGKTDSPVVLYGMLVLLCISTVLQMISRNRRKKIDKAIKARQAKSKTQGKKK